MLLVVLCSEFGCRWFGVCFCPKLLAAAPVVMNSIVIGVDVDELGKTHQQPLHLRSENIWVGLRVSTALLLPSVCRWEPPTVNLELVT